MPPPSDPKLLLLETSGAVGRIGLGQGTTLLAEAVLDRQRRHTRDLAPQIRLLLQKQEWKMAEIDGIVVSWGPGSYTGLRVGLMTGKTLAYALQKPLMTAPTFAVLAQQALNELQSGQELAVVADAQQDRIYLQTWQKTRVQIAASSVLTLEEGKTWRNGLSSETVTGPGLRQQQKLLPNTISCLPEMLWDPQLHALLSVGLVQYHLGQFADLFTVEPLYLRPSAAEVKWNELGR
jgi:tRNA threonylcarbamoyladenosine biosynthesis protein TsaB